jgi:hypothetical protein
MEIDRARLKACFDEFRELDFPRPTGVDDLHDELIVYDSHIAGLIVRLLGGASPEVAHQLYVAELIACARP